MEPQLVDVLWREFERRADEYVEARDALRRTGAELLERDATIRRLMRELYEEVTGRSMDKPLKLPGYWPTVPAPEDRGDG